MKDKEKTELAFIGAVSAMIALFALPISNLFLSAYVVQYGWQKFFESRCGFSIGVWDAIVIIVLVNLVKRSPSSKMDKTKPVVESLTELAGSILHPLLVWLILWII